MLPGDILMVATSSWQSKGIRLVTRSPVNHAMVMVSATTVVEAQPGGALESSLANYGNCPQWASKAALTDTQRGRIVVAARSMIGTPYSWVDDGCIALTDLLGVHVPPWVRARLGERNYLECAQLADRAYLLAGVHLFADGRLPGAVAPADLYSLWY